MATRRATAFPGVVILVIAASCGAPPDKTAEDTKSAGEEVSDEASATEEPQSVPADEVRGEAEAILERMMMRQRAARDAAVDARATPSASATSNDGDAIPAVLRADDESPAPGEPTTDPELDLQKAFAEIARAAKADAGDEEGANPGPEEDPSPGREEDPSPGREEDPSPGPSPTSSPNPAPTTVDTRSPQNPTPEESEPAPRPSRPAGKTEFYTFFHKTSSEFVKFLSMDFGDLVQKGHVSKVDGKPHTVLFFGEDATIAQLTQLADQYDDLELEIERVTIVPMYVDVAVMIESLTMAGLANVWSRVEETVTSQQLASGNKWKTIGSHKHSVYAQGSIAKGQSAPISIPSKVPYIFEMPWTDPFVPPPVSTGRGDNTAQQTIDFRNAASTERRGVLVAVGTADDVSRIQAFVDSIDRPAKQIMIEVQLIQLDADQISDIGIDSVQLGQRHSILDFAGPFPGENIEQPGVGDALRRPGVTVPPVVSEGLTYLFDDSSIDLSGRFLGRLHYLVRTGDAKVKARPKILTLDDRQSILHIGEEVPTFESTGVTRETSGGNFVTEVNSVTTQYVGFTLNMRPKISGDEIALQLEVVSNQLRGRERVFEEDLAGVPIVARRRFTGQPRVKNHRPIILGGLITEEEIESRSMVPILGEIPVFGRLFSRTQKEKRRTEVILVVTPHILNSEGVDRVATPKESLHFDTFDSVLFNDRHIIKGGDVWGIDPITKLPASVQGEVFDQKEVIDLTLLNIVRRRNLVSKLDIFKEYMPDEAAKLSWLQRRNPERSVYYWPDHEKEIYFKAAAIVIENIKELNHPLEYDDIVVPRREIVLPTTPYRMTLSYDKYKTLAEKGSKVLRDAGNVELSPELIELLREAAATRTPRHFADYVSRNGIRSVDHAELAAELARVYESVAPIDDRERHSLDPTDYGGFWTGLANAQIDFVTIAAYFQENLVGRYVTTGRPNVGRFQDDLKDFLATTVTISQRAKRLQELESKWNALSQE